MSFSYSYKKTCFNEYANLLKNKSESFLQVEIKPESEPQLREVQVNVQFLRIGEIDTINEKYYAEISIESKWLESKLIQKYDPKTDWNPKLYIENALLEPKEEILYEIRKFYDMFIIKEIRLVKGKQIFNKFSIRLSLLAKKKNLFINIDILKIPINKRNYF